MFSNLVSGGLDKVVGNVAKGLDNLFTSDEERLQAKNMLHQIKSEMKKHTEDFEVSIEKEITKRTNAKRDIIVAEAKGESWLQRNWRPVVMMTFTFIIANNYILAPYLSALFTVNIPTLKLTDQMFSLISLGLGGYVMGRSLEKSVKAYKGMS
jgi:hypothetical protein